MVTITFHSTGTEKIRFGKILQNLWKKFDAKLVQESKIRVVRHLRSLSDEQLKELNFSDMQIRSLRLQRS